VALTDKDLSLKLCVSALFRTLGYTVFQEVDLCTYSYQPKYTRRQVTDFDVLGVHVESDFALRIAVAECKSVEERAMENLLKLNGTKEFFNADKAYFVQNRIDLNAREVGRELGIWVLDSDNLSTLMAGIGISKKPHVEIETKVYAAKSKALVKQKGDFLKITDYLRYDFWTLPEHRNVINLLRLAQQASKQLVPTKTEHKALMHQLATNLALSITQLTGEVVRHNINDLQDGSLTRILGGPRERRDKEAIFDSVAQLVPDSRLTAVPPFHDQLSELIARFVNALFDASKVVPCLDQLTRRIWVKEVDKTNGEPNQNYGDRTLKLARDVILFLVNQSGIPKDIFDVSLTD